jgi:hypothetical protein
VALSQQKTAKPDGLRAQNAPHWRELCGQKAPRFGRPKKAMEVTGRELAAKNSLAGFFFANSAPRTRRCRFSRSEINSLAWIGVFDQPMRRRFCD